MQLLKNKILRNKSALAVIAIALVLLSAAALLWFGNAHSNQAILALSAKVYFDGDYRIGDGPWQKIVSGQHIPSTKGDVTLRGNFHMLTPDGEYVGLFSGDTPIAFYADHINLTFYEGENEPYVLEVENPLFGKSFCGACWFAYTLTSAQEEPIEIRIHNPHRFGNETAIDELLSNLAFWSGIEFEKGVMDSGALQRNTGLFFVIVSLVLLGTAIFSTLIHIKRSSIMWLFGLLLLFAGGYFVFSSHGVSFWQDSIVTNTTALGCTMMFYMLFLAMVVTQFLKGTKTAGIFTVSAICILDMVSILLPVATGIYFYDTWLYWAILQTVANCILLVCLIKECFYTTGMDKWFQISLILPLVSFGLDAAMTFLGIWQGGMMSKPVFCLLFVIALVVVLRIIPQGINAAEKAKTLETERNALNAQLAESRISIMMSQIRPHFIYNTLGSIEYLCEEDPTQARTLVHSFAKYLRGNFRELDNPRPIRMSQELEHVRHYLNIEKVRFPDMTFTFETNSSDFMLPALTIQPIVENAVKHGLMPLEHGGSIHVTSWDTPTHYCICVEDDGVGFDPGILPDSRKHIGLRNIRARLETMVSGSLEIESAPGKGTKVQITIPRESNPVC